MWTSVSEGSYLFSVARGAEKAKAERGKKRERETVSAFGVFTGFGFCSSFCRERALLLLSFLLLAKPDSGGATGCYIATLHCKKKGVIGCVFGNLNPTYRVTIQVVLNLPLTSNQKLRFSTWASY